MNYDYIVSKTLAKDINLVENIQLIKVMVIKKKFVDQIMHWNIPTDIPWKDTVIIGAAENHTVVFKVSDKLFKLHVTDFRDKLNKKYTDEAQPNKPDYSMIQKEVDRIIKSIPQIFTE